MNENTKEFVEVAEKMPTDFYQRAASHFLKAVRKHPRFADALFFNGEREESTRVGLLKQVELYLKLDHIDIVRDEMNGTLRPHSLLNCEYREAMLEFVKGDKAACVDELYDAVAVLMRMIAVVEGKQQLGGAK